MKPKNVGMKLVDKAEIFSVRRLEKWCLDR